MRKSFFKHSLAAIIAGSLLSVPAPVLSLEDLAATHFYRCQVLTATGAYGFLQVASDSVEEAARQVASLPVQDTRGRVTTVRSAVECVAGTASRFKDLTFQYYVDKLER